MVLKENKKFIYKGKIIIVTLVLIFVAGLIVGNIPFGGFTGSYLKTFTDVTPGTSSQYEYLKLRSEGITEITLDKDVVQAGETIIIDLKPGIEGVSDKLRLVYSGAEKQKECDKGLGIDRNIQETFMGRTTRSQGFKIFEPIEIRYRIPGHISDGFYKICGYDYKINDWVDAELIVYRQTYSEDILTKGYPGYKGSEFLYKLGVKVE